MPKPPMIFPRTVDFSLRARYAETDRMGIVYHANYIVWFEIGRTEFCREAGLPTPSWRTAASSFSSPVSIASTAGRRATTTKCAFEPGWASSAPGGSSFFYEIENASGELLAEGSTRHLFVDSANRTIPIPASVRAVFLDFVRD